MGVGARAGVELPVRVLLEFGLKGRRVPWDRGLADTGAGEPFDCEKQRRLVRGHEAGRPPAGCGARGPANAVDVVLRHVGKVEIDDVADVRHVDATGSDVRGDQHPDPSAAEVLKSTLTLALRAVGVNPVRLVTGPLE